MIDPTIADRRTSAGAGRGQLGPASGTLGGGGGSRLFAALNISSKPSSKSGRTSARFYFDRLSPCRHFLRFGSGTSGVEIGFNALVKTRNCRKRPTPFFVAANVGGGTSGRDLRAFDGRGTFTAKHESDSQHEPGVRLPKFVAGENGPHHPGLFTGAG